jgi:hypothetical protein
MAMHTNRDDVTQVSSTETGIIYGNIVYDVAGCEDPRLVVCKEKTLLSLSLCGCFAL